MAAQDRDLKNLLLRAEVLGRKNWLHAVNILEKATDDYPRERAIYLTLGDIYTRQRKYEQAIDSYQKALTIDPHDEHLMFIIGNCYLSLSDYKMALYYYDQVSGDTPELQYNKALAYAYNGEHELSLHYLKLLIRTVADNVNIYYFLIEEYLRLHKYEDSLHWLDQLEKRFGLQRYQQILKGFVYSFKKVWLKSYMAFKLADEISPILNPDHLHSYGQASWQIGQLEKAADIMNRAIAINPYISSIHEDLIRICLQQNNITAAESALDRAYRELDKANPVLMILREKLKKLKSEQQDIQTPDEPERQH
jgi:tetratricopeptide (TPR) repeat protein